MQDITACPKAPNPTEDDEPILLRIFHHGVSRMLDSFIKTLSQLRSVYTCVHKSCLPTNLHGFAPVSARLRRMWTPCARSAVLGSSMVNHAKSRTTRARELQSRLNAPFGQATVVSTQRCGTAWVMKSATGPRSKGVGRHSIWPPNISFIPVSLSFRNSLLSCYCIHTDSMVTAP
jgi:hypothetical protein